MKKLLALFALIFVGTIGWRVGENLSSDAVSMAVGLLLGVMAGIPTALLVLASDRRQRAYDDAYRPPQRPQRALSPRIEQHTHYHLHGAQMPVQGHHARQIERES